MEEQLSQRSQELPEEAVIEGMEIEAGEINDLDSSSPVQFHELKHRAYTARNLAYWLVFLLGFSWFVHYGATLYFEWQGKDEAAENLSKTFSSWLPIISGLVGGAVTYYFTRENK